MTLSSPTACPQPIPEVTLIVTDALEVSSLQELWTRLEEAASLQPGRLVVDLSSCRHLDAQAIRVLLDVHQLLWSQDGRLVLRGCTPSTIRLLSLAGVLGVFDLEQAPSEVAAG